MRKGNNGIVIGIVEDEPQVADLYKTALTALGMSISFIAGDGLEAIKAFNESDPRPDIVIMDHRMPIMTGVAAMKEMLKLNPETRYIIVSADSSIREDALEAGALMFLEKPIKLKQLTGCIQNLRQGSAIKI
jgi:two-component system chemotaxis response regulator CheY